MVQHISVIVCRRVRGMEGVFGVISGIGKVRVNCSGCVIGSDGVMGNECMTGIICGVGCDCVSGRDCMMWGECVTGSNCVIWRECSTWE